MEKIVLEKMQLYTADKKPKVIDQFNEIFFKHLKRLIGSKYGIGKLILDPLTISIITLLMERENEIEGFALEEIDRYTRETLIEDVEDMGFSDDQDMNVIIENMIRKDYIRVDGTKLTPQKPAISMARLMDLVFPKMPGMNLIAYFVQTLGEVKTNRKDIDSAACQFDQILKMQGMPLEKASQGHKPSKVSGQSADKKIPIHELETSPQNIEKVSPDREFKTPSILGRKSRNNPSDHSKGFFNEPKVLSPDVYNGKTKITKLNFGESGLKKVEPDNVPSGKHEQIESEKSEASDEFLEKPFHDTDESQNREAETTISLQEPTRTDLHEHSQAFDASSANISEQEYISSVDNTSQVHKSNEQAQSKFYDNKIVFSNTASPQKKNETVVEIFDDNRETRLKKEDTPIHDKDIEKRIAAFEEDLALECPICRRSKLQVKNTATRRSYYKCSNQECSFISWGKPHHIICPECNNPFLIEALNKDGIANLKCPRATCRYWKKIRSDKSEDQKEQKDSTTQRTNTTASMHQKPRRRVVRRRVVRRKK